MIIHSKKIAHSDSWYKQDKTALLNEKIGEVEFHLDWI